MLAFDQNLFQRKLQNMERLLKQLPDIEDVRNRAAMQKKAEGLIRDLLGIFMEQVEYIVSRFEQSMPTAYRDRVRALAELELCSRREVENHLVPLATHYEDWASVHKPLSKQKLLNFLTKHRGSLDEVTKLLRDFMRDAEELGFEVKNKTTGHEDAPG